MEKYKKLTRKIKLWCDFKSSSTSLFNSFWSFFPRRTVSTQCMYAPGHVMVKDVSASFERDIGTHFHDKGFIRHNLWTSRFYEMKLCGSFLIRFYCRLEKSLTTNCAGLAFRTQKSINHNPMSLNRQEGCVGAQTHWKGFLGVSKIYKSKWHQEIRFWERRSTHDDAYHPGMITETIFSGLARESHEFVMLRFEVTINQKSY